MNKIKAIISDADGTLVNTVYLIRHGQYEAMVEHLIKKNVPRQKIPKYEVYENYLNKSVGGKIRETFEKTLKLMFSNPHEHLLKKIDFDELDATLSPIQDHLALLYVHPFHGLTELLTWLGKNEISMGIFTSGSRRHIVRNFGVSLPVMGYEDLFRSDEIDIEKRFYAFKERAKAVYGLKNLEIITCDDVKKTKPDPEGILKIMDKLNVKTDEVLVVGDLTVDIQAAMAAGVHALGITHGFGTPAELKEAGATRVIENLLMLPKLIEGHNCGKKRLF